MIERHERFKTENQASADHVLFNFPVEMIPVMVTSCGDEVVMIHTKTTLGQSEIIEKGKNQNISTLRRRKSPKLTDKNDAKYDLTLVKNYRHWHITRNKSGFRGFDQ